MLIVPLFKNHHFLYLLVKIFLYYYGIFVSLKTEWLFMKFRYEAKKISIYDLLEKSKRTHFFFTTKKICEISWMQNKFPQWWMKFTAILPTTIFLKVKYSSACITLIILIILFIIVAHDFATYWIHTFVSLCRSFDTAGF